MYTPSPAREIHPPGPHHYAGVCQALGPSTPHYGWFVPYCPVPGYTDAYDAVIDLLVVDLSSGFADVLPFVIDTGTDVTIIPRRLLTRHDVFPPSKALGAYSVTGLTGRVVTGLRFRAAIAIASLRPEPPPLSFGVMKPVVVDDWREDYGMLGLDVLLQVVMISDADQICLWPPVHVPAQLTVEHLMTAVKQLLPDELREFKRQFAAWQEQNGQQTEEESALIQATKVRLPAVDERRLKRLIAKSERDTLSPKELNEYRALAQRAEQLNVTRVEALAELVRRRGKPARVIMEEIGWESGADGA